MKKVLKFAKHCLVLFIIFLSMTSCSCGGNVKNVQVNVEDSSLYNSEEIEKAADVVIKYFKKYFDDCTLISVKYDEKYTLSEREYGADVIVLISEYDVGNSGGDGSLSPNTRYSGWQWILERDDNGTWNLIDYGY